MIARRGFKALLIHSFPTISTLCSTPFFSVNRSSSSKVSHPTTSKAPNFTLFSTISRFVSTFSSDTLEGLVDQEDPLALDGSKVESFSAEEFGFLRGSLLGSSSDSGSSVGESDLGKFSSEALLISNAIRNNKDEFGDHTQKFLRQFRDKLNGNLVVEVLKLVQNPELGMKFFMWAGRQIGYSHTGYVYDALLEMLQSDNNNNNFRVPEHFLREIKSDDKEVLGKLLNILIRKCCRYGLWNVALEELGRLKDFGYKATRPTYNALIQVFIEANKLDTAQLVHREMWDSGFRMDDRTLGCLSRALCEAGRWREALTLIDNEEFVPTTALYTNMIYGLCEASLFDVAMDFLDRMRSCSCIPNVVTYRILLCGCLRKRQLGRCKRILSMMIAEGCYPSPKIFNSLVHAYCKSGDYSYAYKLLRKMVKCGCKPGYVVYNILIGGICSKNELPSSDLLDLAEKAYSEMLNAGIVLNKVNVSNFARCLCGAGKFEKAYNVISEMMSKGFVPDASTYSNVIEFLCSHSKVEKAFFLFEEMQKNGIVPDVYTYTILIDNFCKAGLIQQARNWFNEMMEKGCSPNVVTYTALIHAYLKARKVNDANQLFEMMLDNGCIPNVVTYTALIDGHFKAGEIEKACLIYTRMKGDVENSDMDIYFRLGDCNSKEPNVFTYGALVDGLCKAHKVKEARDLLDAMLAGDCVPNHIVYDALIDGFCKAGKLDEAQVVFTKMSEHGYSPNAYTYSSLIDRLFKDQRLDLVLKVLSKMLENSCEPNVVIYTEMIDGLCKVGKTDEAYKLMLMMEEKGCYPNVVTYTAMIDGFGKAGKIYKCLELLREMGSKGCAPNFVTYRVLINHCCTAGLLDEARELLDEMKQTYWPKHMASYCKVIEGYNREFIASLGLLNEISESDNIPIFPVYSILVDNFIKAGKLDVALQLHEEISSSSPLTSLNKRMYNSLIESLSHASNVDKAFGLFAKMVTRGGVPELSTFIHLIKGLRKVNKWEEALQLSDSICQMDIIWLQQEETSD
ncbi:pentatricopeptide repeat-containing protein At1g06710, mitochondrial [Ziziphus jujuba]|uniref:Pentatricopeptide repeat-containing protein At1g06710, mitochondrial n=1 Tax=Ziziphus jujuba TaxID=326968 RepID=A0A6P4A170_ZIZJJ|nr:pentatricopeptide repeat-containing protein At1g06710, mitochondrial [Ziziphus jujuba]